MKNIVNLLLFLFVFLSACSDDSILEELKPEPPKSDVEEPKPDDDSENSGDNQNSVLPILYPGFFLPRGHMNWQLLKIYRALPAIIRFSMIPRLVRGLCTIGLKSMPMVWW